VTTRYLHITFAHSRQARTYSNFGDRFSRLPVQKCGLAFHLVLGKRTSAIQTV